MLIVSTRRDNSVFSHGPVTWHPKDTSQTPLCLTEVRYRLAGQKCCVLIHGFNVADALDAYGSIAYQLRENYQAFVGATWPGSTFVTGFWFARHRAATSGKLLANALSFLDPSLLDIQAHSLGCRVALEALNAGLRCRNLILAAAAVGAGDLSGRYAGAAMNAARVIVAHSKHDGVLSRAYRLALWSRALGLDGPAPGPTPPTVEAWDVAAGVEKHGDYKRSRFYLDRWREAA